MFLNFCVVGGLQLNLGEETHAEPRGLPAGFGVCVFSVLHQESTNKDKRTHEG